MVSGTVSASTTLIANGTGKGTYFVHTNIAFDTIEIRGTSTARSPIHFTTWHADIGVTKKWIARKKLTAGTNTIRAVGRVTNFCTKILIQANA